VLAVMLGGSDGPLLSHSTVPAFSFPEPAASVLGRMWAYGRWRSTEAGSTVVTPADVDVERAAAILHDSGAVTLTLDDATELLAAYGVGAPAGRALQRPSSEQLVATAREIGYPVVLKAFEQSVRHRFDQVGVRLSLGDAERVRGAYEELAAGRRGPGSPSICPTTAP